MLEGLQTRLGINTHRRRFVDLESARDLEDISDPETTDDESSTSLREWAKLHPGWAILATIVVVVVVGLVLRWSAQLAVGIITSPWTYVVIAAALVLGWTFRKGWRWRDQQVTDYDELHLKTGDGTRSYKGRYIELVGKTDAFVPIKGWSGLWSSPRPYQNAEIAAGMNESFDPWEVEGEEAAVIRLEPGEHGTLTGISDTEWGGKKVVQETSSIEPDPNGNYTSLKCTLPEFDDQRVDGLREQVEQLRDDLGDAREEIDALRRRNRNLTDRMHDPIDEQMDSRIDQYERLAHVADGRRRPRTEDGTLVEPREDWRGPGTMSANEKELKEVEEEVSDDDD